MSHVLLLIDSLNYIEEHLKDDIKTIDIANAVHCAKSTIEKMFQHVYSVSIHEYIIRRRMMLAARLLSGQPQTSILTVAVECGYNSHEAFARAFRKVWNCNPSEFRTRKYSELYPKFRAQIQEGDEYTMQRKNFDISQLYDLFCQRRDCYIICCDIKSLIPINNIARKAGDLAILEAMKRMGDAAGAQDVIFRIGGDEFCILTDSTSARYAQEVADRIKRRNGETFPYEDQQIPLSLYVAPTKIEAPQLKYDDLFAQLHQAIKEAKPE